MKCPKCETTGIEVWHAYCPKCGQQQSSDLPLAEPSGSASADRWIGWENKWQCAVDMAARAELERDELRSALIRLHDAVTRRMTADDVTPDDRRELFYAWNNAANFIPQNSVFSVRRVDT